MRSCMTEIGNIQLLALCPSGVNPTSMGDRMFEGSADDRVLGKRGAFLTGAGWSRADYARFATKAEALAAAEAATNRRPKSLLLAIEET